MITSIHDVVGEVASARSDRRAPIVRAHDRAAAGIVFVKQRRTDTHADACAWRVWRRM
jgi:hypothetical protein